MPIEPPEDLDLQATAGRADRPQNHRTRLAARIVARAAWLDAPLLFWTGEPQGVPRLAGAVLPARALLEDRLTDLPAGLYAASVGLAETGLPDRGRRRPSAAPDAPGVGGPLRLAVTAIHAVTRDSIADTARAIEAAVRFPRAAARLVGPVDRWREAALGRLDAKRRAVDGASAWRVAAPEALSLEARALWFGSAPAPSATLPATVLTSWTTSLAPDRAAARLAAAALGRRHAVAACDPSLAAWAAAGRALDRWPSAAVAWIATAVGAETVSSLAHSWPALNDPVGAAWVDECNVDGAPASADEIADIARLLSAIAAVRSEPARRHALLCQLAIQYLQIGSSTAASPGAVAEPFRELVLEQVYGEVRDFAVTRRHRVPASVSELAGRWLGDELLGGQMYAYVDNVLAGAGMALGRHAAGSVFPGVPSDLSECVPPGGALDPAAGATVVAVAHRLRRKGAANAVAALAGWLDACRPLVPLGTFWRDALAVVPSGPLKVGGEQAPNLAESVSRHGRALVAELVLGERSTAVRALLPAVLARGPEALDHVLRRDLWLPDEDSLDAGLHWVQAVESGRPAGGATSAVPMPRDVFLVGDPRLRTALTDLGARMWEEAGVGAGDIENLLGMLAGRVSQPGATYWVAALPRLRDVAGFLARRVLSASERPSVSIAAPFVVLTILDACARWDAAGFEETSRLARILTGRWRSAGRADEEWSRADADRNDLIVRLSEGRISRFLALLQHPPAPRKSAWRAADGWVLAQAHPVACAWLSACLDRTELVARVVLLLERLALVARLDSGLTAARFFEPLDRPPGTAPAWPAWVPPDAVATLDHIARARGVAGAARPLPASLRRLLEGFTLVGDELAALRARAALRPLSSSERARLDGIECLVADPATHAADLGAALHRALPKQLALAGLAALEALVNGDLTRRWQKVLGAGAASLEGPAWDNALHMLGTVSHNRRVLRRLLRQAARLDHTWMRALGPNRAFLDAIGEAGLHPDEWLAGRSLVVAGPSGPLRAYAATDPLEVLQMGSLFGTCLSAGSFNAHAAVAAAVEANKRVLFVKDVAGRVLGRQLLALTKTGEVLGFTCYGAAAEGPGVHGAWIKLALELLALDLARATRARLATGERVSAGLDGAAEQALMLFCRGYVDSLEAFDWWIDSLAAADPRSGSGDRAILRSLVERPVAPHLDARTCPPWRREELGWAACRALLWLGAEAPSFSDEQAEVLGLGVPQRELLRASRSSVQD